MISPWRYLATLLIFNSTFAGRAFAQIISGDEIAALLSELVRVNTSNPPGNEAVLDRLLDSKLRPLGLQIDIIPTPQPGKSHFIARLKGDGSKKPVLLAAHADTVGVERDKWTVDPFGGIVEEGYVFGRGALDFKGGLAVFLEAVTLLAKNKVPLARDVILLSEADEEGGRYSASWLAENHWNKIACEFSLNEGGWIIKNPAGQVRYISLSTADKVSISLKLIAHGTSTHSSLPRPDNAIFVLAKALARIADYDTKPLLTLDTRRFLLTLAKTSRKPMSIYLDDLVNSADPAKLAAADQEIRKDPLLHAISRNTIAPVFLNAGVRGNVVPGSAEATINFRAIPGTTPEQLRAEMKNVIQDPKIEILAAIGAGTPAGETHGNQPSVAATNLNAAARLTPSPTNTILYEALARNASAEFNSAPVTPYLFQAGTDGLAWRRRGVPVYGIYPYPIDAEDLARMHGIDERVSIRGLQQGVELIYKTLVEVAGK